MIRNGASVFRQAQESETQQNSSLIWLSTRLCHTKICGRKLRVALHVVWAVLAIGAEGLRLYNGQILPTADGLLGCPL